MNKRIGQLGKTCGKFDNGFYTVGEIINIPVEFLIDTGSTTTLISCRIFDKIPENQKPDLVKTQLNIRDVNGNSIVTYGQSTMQISFGKVVFPHAVIVCDITPDAIIGQDFLLKYVTRIDYQRMILQTELAAIQCWIAGEAQMVCRVEVQEEVVVPANSRMFIPVHIPCCEKLGEQFVVEPSVPLFQERNIAILPGIMQNSEKEKFVSIQNFNDTETVVYPKMKLGVCESYYEMETAQVRHTAILDGEEKILPDYLKDVWERSSVNLTKEESGKLAQLLTKYQGAFAKSSADIGRTNLVQHEINTGNAAPIRQPPRRLPFGKRQIEKEEIQKMLDRGIIEPSSSAWSSNTVLITKRDGSTRFCCDFRKVNEITYFDSYPLPRISDCLDALSSARWFGCMDLNSGFWQISMKESDKEKTAFSTSQGLYQFRVMPFGLCTAPSSFQRLMENVLRGLQWEECLLYLDDIIVAGATVEESLQRLENVFKRLLDANLKLKPSKCLFFQKSIKFLGHIVSESGVQTDPEKTEAVKNWPRPKNQKQLRSFLGLCSYYRRFVSKFADIARPLHKLCEKNSAFNWNDQCEDAFVNLKEALISPPILAYPKMDAKFILDTDASDKAVGAVLSQEQDGQERVIAYMSKAMNKHEQSYCVTRKELLAVVCALRNFHSYLYGREILLRTDNAAVSWMRNLKTPTGQVARWLQELGTYNLKVVHRPGLKHRNADALSRNPCKTCSRQEHASAETDSEDESEKQEVNVSTRAVTRSQNNSVVKNNQFFLCGWDKDKIRQLQLEDITIGFLLIKFEQQSEKPSWNDVSEKSTDLKTLWNMWDRFQVCEGVLYVKWINDVEQEQLRLVVPEPYRSVIMKYCHDIPTAGHLGVEKTIGKIKQNFYWPGLKEFVQEYIRKCDYCTSRKTAVSQKSRAPLGTYNVGAPMERVAIDILGPLPKTKRGNKYCLVVTDCFTKWTEAYGIPDQESATVAKFLVNEFVCRFGTPLQIHTDQGSNFESRMFHQLCDLLCVDKTRTTSFHPQSNGCVERFNRTLIKMLSMYCAKDQQCWDEYLPQVLLAYRSSVHSTTGFTPNFLVFGREVTLPLSAFIEKPKSTEYTNLEDYVADLQHRIKLAHELARKNLKKNTQYQKKHYDVKSKKRILEVGQPVWIHDPTRKIGVCHKLCAKWKGPYIITKRLDDTTYLVKKTAKQLAKAYHVDRLLPYVGRNPPRWYKKP